MASEGVMYGEGLHCTTFWLLAKAVLRYLLDDFTLSLTTVRGAVEQLLIKASKEATTDFEDEVLDVDSGFGEPDSEDDTPENAPTFSRPRGVTDRDWRVYQVLDEMLRELDQKFRAMWA
jgi:hypothetical protein